MQSSGAAFWSAAALLLFGVAVYGEGISGHWTLSLDPDLSGVQSTLECEITQDGRAITVECGEEAPMAGTIDGPAVKFVMMTGDNGLLQAKFTGALNDDGNGIVGTWRLEDTGGNRIGRFKAQKR